MRRTLGSRSARCQFAATSRAGAGANRVGRRPNALGQAPPLDFYTRRTMAEPSSALHPVAPIEQRVGAVEAALHERGLKPAEAIAEQAHLIDEEWIARQGARVVARAWTEPAYRERLLTDGRDAVIEMGIAMPRHHRHLVALENSARVHNVICCTLCSCTAFTVIGLPPDWYKDLEYRARIVRESRSVLREMGLDLPADVEIRVWDTTADTRYIVIPERPAHTAGWSADRLADSVTRDGMIGVARL